MKRIQSLLSAQFTDIS